MSLLSLQVSLYNGFTSFSPIPFTTLYGITIDENFAGDFFRKLSQRLKEESLYKVCSYSPQNFGLCVCVCLYMYITSTYYFILFFMYALK